MWQHVLWTLTREAPWTHVDNTKEFYTTDNTKEFYTTDNTKKFPTYNASLAFGNLIKGQPHVN
jgi:hypothetical protein